MNKHDRWFYTMVVKDFEARQLTLMKRKFWQIWLRVSSIYVCLFRETVFHIDCPLACNSSEPHPDPRHSESKSPKECRSKPKTLNYLLPLLIESSRFFVYFFRRVLINWSSATCSCSQHILEFCTNSGQLAAPEI